MKKIPHSVENCHTELYILHNQTQKQVICRQETDIFFFTDTDDYGMIKQIKTEKIREREGRSVKKSTWIWIAVAVAVLVLLGLLLTISLAEPKTVIGICYRDHTVAENKESRSALEQSLKDRGYEVIVIDANGDQARQMELVQELKDRDCKALVVEPVMAAALGELLEAIHRTGLPGVIYNRDVEEELLRKYPKIACVSADWRQPGALQAQILPQLPEGGDLNGDGVVSYIVLQGPEDHISAAAGLQALETALAEGPLETACISVSYGDWTKDSGAKNCKQALAAYGKDIEVVFCGNNQIAEGSAEAIADGGRTVGQDIYLIGAGEQKAPAEQGHYTAVAYLDAVKLARCAADTVAARLVGTQTAQRIVIPYVAVIGKGT